MRLFALMLSAVHLYKNCIYSTANQLSPYRIKTNNEVFGPWWILKINLVYDRTRPCQLKLLFEPNWCVVKNMTALQWKLINWWYVTGLIKYDQTVIKNSCQHRRTEWLGITWRILMAGISGHIYCVVGTNRGLINWHSWLTAACPVSERIIH